MKPIKSATADQKWLDIQFAKTFLQSPFFDPNGKSLEKLLKKPHVAKWYKKEARRIAEERNKAQYMLDHVGVRECQIVNCPCSKNRRVTKRRSKER